MNERIDENDGSIDLSCLDPGADAAHFDGLLRRIHEAAAPELMRRTRDLSLWALIARWRTAIAAVAGILVIASIVVLATVPRARSISASDALTEAMGVPRGLASYVNTGVQPTPGALLENGWRN